MTRRLVSLVALVAAALLPVASASRAGAATSPACSAATLTFTSTQRTLPGGTTVLAFGTNHRAGGCQWSPSTSFSWIDAKGSPVGAPFSGGARAPILVGYLNQVALKIATTEGVPCRTASASGLLIRTHPAVVVRLRMPIGVCVSGTTAWTRVLSAELGFVRPCTHFRITLGRGNGALGTYWYPLIFTNDSGTNCEAQGWPVVRAMSRPGPTSLAMVLPGPPARHEALGGEPVNVMPGSAVTAQLGIVDTGNYDRSSCKPADAKSLTVSLQRSNTVYLPLRFSVCQGLASLVVQGIKPVIVKG